MHLYNQTIPKYVTKHLLSRNSISCSAFVMYGQLKNLALFTNTVNHYRNFITFFMYVSDVNTFGNKNNNSNKTAYTWETNACVYVSQNCRSKSAIPLRNTYSQKSGDIFQSIQILYSSHSFTCVSNETCTLSVVLNGDVEIIIIEK